MLKFLLLFVSIQQAKISCQVANFSSAYCGTTYQVSSILLTW